MAVVLLASALGWSVAEAPAVAAAPGVVLLGDTQLDPAALYFVSFDGLVNNASYQQSAILSFVGYQYAAWYTSSREAVVARRKLPAGPWEIAVLPHQLSTNDSHNTISLGISPVDGRLHIAMDTHDSTVFYVKSEALPFGRIVTASKASGWTDWTLRFDGSGLGAFGEVVIDRSRVASDGVLSIMYQRSSSGTSPSPIRVVDFQID